jgi:hypothetical protein
MGCLCYISGQYRCNLQRVGNIVHRIIRDYPITASDVIGMNYHVLIQETIDCMEGASYNPTAFKLLWVQKLVGLSVPKIRAKCLVALLFSKYRDVLPMDTGALVLNQLITELRAVNGQSEYFDFEYEQLKDGLISMK